MKKQSRFLTKGSIFIVIQLSLLFMINQILLPKDFYNHTWPNTVAFQGFYKMRKNSIDVLFLGSSHCVSAFSPQEIYDTCGIRSYNLGSEQQSLLVSYYWLKEALRYQKPKVVVLDTYICFEYNKEEPLNVSEGAVRKAMDMMKWSNVKMEAIKFLCLNDKDQTASSYYFPNIRFHTRWKNLNEDDFTYLELNQHYELKGYSMLMDDCNNKDYRPFQAGSSVEQEKMVPLMEEYLEKIVDFCKENEIQLILVKTPTVKTNIQKYNTVNQFADKHQLSYYDFNEEILYHEIGFEFFKDNQDGGHVNYRGAKKISRKIADILINEFGVENSSDDQWEVSRVFYQEMLQNIALRDITDINQYLDTIKNEYYTIFMAVKDESSKFMNGDIRKRMEALGLKIDLTGKTRNSYYAVISADQVVEELGVKKLSYEGSFRNGRSTFALCSAGYDYGNMCSIKIDNQEYAKNQRGLNIVVYDNVCRKVVDSVCFDLYDVELGAIR